MRHLPGSIVAAAVCSLACTSDKPPSAVTLHTATSTAAPPPPRQRPAEVANRYPNEVDGFKFWPAAPWRELVPLEATLADVRRVLGEPESASDLAHYGDPYPGDDKAAQPVLTYRASPGWHAYVYLVRSDLSVSGSYQAAFQDRLLSIDLVPDEPTAFADKIPKSTFHASTTLAADASWTNWEDGTGLRYEVYSHDLPRGKTHAGDLNRIVYGPSDEQTRRARR